MRNPSRLGTRVWPSGLVIRARTTPTTALEVEVPMERIRVLSPLAAPDSDGSTAPRIRAGTAE